MMGNSKRTFKVVCKYTNSQGVLVEETREVQAFNKRHAVNTIRGPLSCKGYQDITLTNAEDYSQPLPPAAELANS